MFSRCLKTMKSAEMMPKTRPVRPSMNHSTNGIAALASIEATEEYPTAMIVAIHTSVNAAPAGQASAQIAP